MNRMSLLCLAVLLFVPEQAILGQGTLASGSSDRIVAQPAVAGALTPESLGMPRSSIVFSGRRLRLFNGRGSVSVRDWGVTGLQNLLFPPIEVRDYRFQLAFREERSKVLIQDTAPEFYERLASTGQGMTPLGLNFLPGTPQVMILQQAYWQPNLFRRTGTYHKELKGQFVSFAIQTEASVSAEADEVYLEVQIQNRQPAPLVLTVIPGQSSPELALKVPNETPQQAGPVTQPDAFTLASSQIRTTVVSDLARRSAEGWSWEIPAQGKQTARFAIILQQAGAPAPDLHAPDLAQRIERADRALRGRLRWAGEQLPRISTGHKQLDDLYYRCILSVLDSRWERENFIVRPFYAVGTWIFTITWDTSYASEMLAILDPEGLREALLTYIRCGLMKRTYIPWNGKANEYWYAQNPFAQMRILQDYLRQTGDLAFLDRTVEGATVLEWMKRAGQELVKRFGQHDGLLDFGAGSEKMLEIRTDGYQHVVAATNGMAVRYFRQLADWCRARKDPDAVQFDQWVTQLQKSINEKLWNEEASWFDNLYPDGSRHLVWSYHLFDVLDAGFLSEAQQRRLVSHLREGEFLGPYGMYSISKADQIHWDWQDTDWGGGGQYTGMPLRIAESVYRLGYSQLGWDILTRCARWTERYPYIPQGAFADYIGDLEEVDMPLEIAAGSGVQAVLFGLFGLRPQMDGALEISPSYHEELGEARMTGYRFRGHTYDVVMGRWEFQVYRDGKLAAQHPYGRPVGFPQP